MLKEFREFAMQGSVIDLAVGVIIGGAFGKIVASLVDDILMPLMGLLLGGIDFTGQALQLGEASIMWGAFVQATIDFLIIAFVIFLIIRAVNRLRKQTAPPAAEAPSKACPFCFSSVPEPATRCPHCTSSLE